MSDFADIATIGPTKDCPPEPTDEMVDALATSLLESRLKHLCPKLFRNGQWDARDLGVIHYALREALAIQWKRNATSPEPRP